MDELIQRLATGDHPIVVSLRPEPTVAAFKECLDRGYIHLKFTNTRGGTELGVRLDPQACDFSAANFVQQQGRVHLNGTLTLNDIPVRCQADIDLATLAGRGHLVPLETATSSHSSV
jgi:hypothetical protein